MTTRSVPSVTPCFLPSSGFLVARPLRAAQADEPNAPFIRSADCLGEETRPETLRVHFFTGWKTFLTPSSSGETSQPAQSCSVRSGFKLVSLLWWISRRHAASPSPQRHSCEVRAAGDCRASGGHVGGEAPHYIKSFNTVKPQFLWLYLFLSQ